MASKLVNTGGKLGHIPYYPGLHYLSLHTTHDVQRAKITSLLHPVIHNICKLINKTNSGVCAQLILFTLGCVFSIGTVHLRILPVTNDHLVNMTRSYTTRLKSLQEVPECTTTLVTNIPWIKRY